MTSVTEILKTVTGSCDFDSVSNYYGKTEDEKRTNFWVDVITTKSSDSGFAKLVESILENGWEEGSAIGWEVNREGGYLTEGHHRLVASILLGVDIVPTHPWGRSGRRTLNAHHDHSAEMHDILVEF